MLELKRGTNVSHWLSQSEARGAERRRRFTREDVMRLAEMGMDHLRLPVDEEQLWDEDGNQEAEAWDLLQMGLDWCREAGLKAMVDLHILRSHYFNAGGSNTLFTEQASVDRFAQCWRELSKTLTSRNLDWVGYELLNEAVAEAPEDWNRVLLAPYQAIRERELERTIAIGSNRWCHASTFPELKVPEGDPNIILVFHYYNSMLITHYRHYRAGWCEWLNDYTGPIQYPGRPIADEVFGTLDPDLQKRIGEENYDFGPEVMAAQLGPALARAKELGYPLWCNEFGVIATVEDEIRRRWYQDFIDTLDRFSIGWSNWDMRGGFGLFDGGNRPTVVAEVLAASGEEYL
ncbi:MAG: glycoside hydrolase family 5 protein [Planctomycetota bacterium]|jgi:endoglucanase